MSEWKPIETVPLTERVLLWNAYENNTYKAGEHRIATPVMENTCDCTHWMPLPEPPEDSYDR